MKPARGRARVYGVFGPPSFGAAGEHLRHLLLPRMPAVQQAVRHYLMLCFCAYVWIKDFKVVPVGLGSQKLPNSELKYIPWFREPNPGVQT